MMYGFSVVLSSETASFRDPGGQLYHATLPLPPVSTIVGISGAAIGFSFKQVWEFFRDKSISVGVKDITCDWRGVPPGKGLDLWKYQKIVSKKVKSDVLKREFIFRPVFRLYYGCNCIETIEQLRKAFVSPAWALSLGTSDDIARVEELSQIDTFKEVNGKSMKLSHSLVPEDQSDNYSFDWEHIQSTSVRTSLELPVVKQLPVDFIFSPDGERKGSKYRAFTFLSGNQYLKTPCSAFIFGQETVSLIKLN